MLPQPGLQAEKIDVEVSRLYTLGRLLARVFVGGTLTRIVKTPAHQAHLEEERMGLGSASLTPRLNPSVPQRAPTRPCKKNLHPAWPHFPPGKTCISAQGKLHPQILLQGKKGQETVSPRADLSVTSRGSAGVAFSPLQGLSSCSIPLHRNWSVTTSLTSVKPGKAFLFSETALIQFSRCNAGSRREEHARRH